MTTYFRKADGTPAVQLGDFQGYSLSPDGNWAIAAVGKNPFPPFTQLQLVPIGAGESIVLDKKSIEKYQWAQWLPDGKGIVFLANEPGHGLRLFIEDLMERIPRPFSPEGIVDVEAGLNSFAVSPDGKLVAAVASDQKLWLYPTDGGKPRMTKVTMGDEALIGWDADGRSIYTYQPYEVPAQIFRVVISTGQKKIVKELVPSDTAGVTSVRAVRMTPDAKSYVYTYKRTLADLYLVKGLK